MSADPYCRRFKRRSQAKVVNPALRVTTERALEADPPLSADDLRLAVAVMRVTAGYICLNVRRGMDELERMTGRTSRRRLREGLQRLRRAGVLTYERSQGWGNVGAVGLGGRA